MTKQTLPLITVDILKQQMVAHLREKHYGEYDNIHKLWGCAKDYAKKKCFFMVGSYTSFGTDISVVLRMSIEDEIMYRFNIDLSEVE